MLELINDSGTSSRSCYERKTIHVLTDEEVQNAYVDGVLHDCYYEGDVKLTPDGLVTAEEFREWKAEVERAAAARALDLAADQWRYHWGSNGEETELWLRARAAEIREGKNDVDD